MVELTAENKAAIDELGYETLLRRWRSAPAGDPWFQGETGKYWGVRMRELRDAGTVADYVTASKRIG